MKKIIPLILCISCGSGKGTKAPPPSPSLPKDRFVDVFELEPMLDWDKSTFILAATETLAQKKDLLNFFEAQAKAWNTSLDHGYIPHLHLSKTKVAYKDMSEGRLKGMEKLKPVWDKLYKRCPSFNHAIFKSPLKVEWHDRSSNGRIFYENNTKGGYKPPYLTVRHMSNGDPFYSATFQSLHAILVWGEKKKYWHYPKQTHREIYGHNAENTPNGADSGSSLDLTFAHEIGHHMFTSWTMNKGKVGLASLHFSEGMAEVFKDICYGEFNEAPFWLDQFPTKEKLIGLGESYARSPEGEIYFADGIKYLISYEKKWGNLDTDKLFKAMTNTWDAMKGRKIKCIPKRFNLPARCQWESAHPIWSHPTPERYSPLAFTRGEFAELFCDHYDCPEEFKPIFKSISENIKDEEY